MTPLVIITSGVCSGGLAPGIGLNKSYHVFTEHLKGSKGVLLSTRANDEKGAKNRLLNSVTSLKTMCNCRIEMF